jgi:hypothetical protein
LLLNWVRKRKLWQKLPCTVAKNHISSSVSILPSWTNSWDSAGEFACDENVELVSFYDKISEDPKIKKIK